MPCFNFCNKQDIEGCLQPDYIKKGMGIEELEKEGRSCHVEGSSATKNQEIKEGLDWMANILLKKK